METQLDSDARTLELTGQWGHMGRGRASTRAGKSGLLHNFCLEQLLVFESSVCVDRLL